MPPAVSFSKLRILSRCVSQPWASSGHPHRRRVTWARSPRETLSRMTGALVRNDESSSAPRRQPRDAACRARLDQRVEVIAEVHVVGAVGRRQP